MSWFGFGGKKEPEPQESAYDFTAGSTSGFSEDAGSSSFDNTAMPSLGGGGGGMGSGMGGGMSQLEELVLAEQQKALVQSVIARLTEMAFDNCIAKPSSSLSSSEQGCIQATVAKYLDTSEFVLGRVQRQARAGKM